MNNHFLSWFAGFLDGEGYFGICPNGNGYMPQVNIKLRSDDIEILKKIEDEIGVGKVYSNLPSQRNTTKKGEVHDQAQWQVANFDGCYAIIKILDKYPLQAKKYKVYKIWREAVLYIKKNGNKKCEAVERMRQEMFDIKKYTST